MKILFIQDNALNESLALADLSAFLKSQGHVCKLLIEREEKKLFSKIRNFSPDIFFMPCSLFGHRWVIDMARRLKDNFNKPIILSGTHATFFPEIIEKENSIDVICLGEADLPISELLSKLERKEDITRIKNIWLRIDNNIYKNEIEYLANDLDSLPFPDRELYYDYKFIRNMTMKRFVSGRGCHHSCAYCLEPLLREKYNSKTRYVRKKSVRRIINEIEILKSKYPLKTIHFSDDVFTFDKNWVIDFVNIYKKEIHLPFTFNADIAELDEEIIGAVKDANCSGIAIGIETANEDYRQFIMNKRISNDKIINTARLIKKYKLNLATFNMIALPGESISDAFRTLKLNAISKTNAIRLNIAFPMPKAKFTQYALDNGYLESDLENNVDKLLETFIKGQYPIFKSRDMNEFRNLYYFFRLGVKFPFLLPLIKILIKMPPLRIFKILDLLILYDERKFFGIPWTIGVKYFLHIGNPMKRTTTYPTLT